MSQNNDGVVHLNLFKKKVHGELTDRDKIVYAYHLLESGDEMGASKMFGTLSPGYMATNFYKDLARALLCWATHKNTNNEDHRKESEFYMIVYRIAKRVNVEGLVFNNSGYFTEMKDTFFRGFNL
jgi:hypothetical protein